MLTEPLLRFILSIKNLFPLQVEMLGMGEWHQISLQNLRSSAWYSVCMWRKVSRRGYTAAHGAAQGRDTNTVPGVSTYPLPYTVGVVYTTSTTLQMPVNPTL